MACPYLHSCPSPREVGTGPIYKRRFCLDQCTSCARYRLARQMPSASIPRWLRPTMMSHADLLLEAWQQGRSLPSSAFFAPERPAAAQPAERNIRQAASDG